MKRRVKKKRATRRWKTINRDADRLRDAHDWAWQMMKLCRNKWLKYILSPAILFGAAFFYGGGR